MPERRDTPSVRASHCKATLRTLKALRPEAVPRVLAALSDEVREGLEVATTVEHVPAAWDVALVKAVTAALGGPGTRVLARATMLDGLRGPLLGSFLTGALAVLGPSPARLFGWAGRVWSHVTTGCGVLRLEAADEGTASLELEGMPRDLAAPAYLEAVAGTLESIYVVCGVAGEVESKPRVDGARFLARWGPGTPPATR
jgi:hypothetical protein